MIKRIKKIKHSADARYGNLSRFGQFCLVGASGMCIDLSTYYLLLRAANIPFQVSSALAILLAMTWNFWLNRRLTFSYSRTENLVAQYFKFVSACALGNTISWLISIGLPHFNVFFNQHLVIAKFVGIIVGTFFNFTTSLLWVFKKR
jgi:dolichol-phosphate mannosyltransferase